MLPVFRATLMLFVPVVTPLKHFSRPLQLAPEPAGIKVGAHKTVWINGFGRSLTSTVLAVLETAPHTDFALFEPCHQLDKTAYGASFVQCMQDVANCDFSRISYLWGWDKPLSKTLPGAYSSSSARSECTTAGTRLFKTITPELIEDFGRSAVPILEDHPEMHMVTIDRDPRDIFSSEKLCFGNKSSFNRLNVTEMCRVMQRNMHASHPRLIRLDFHRAVTQPAKVFADLFQSIGLPFGPDTAFFIANNFDQPFCRQTSYGTCRRNSTSRIGRWRKHLSAEESRKFAETPECQEVIEHFGYDLA